MNPWKIVGWIIAAGLVLAIAVTALVTWTGVELVRQAAAPAPAERTVPSPAPFAAPANTPAAGNGGCSSHKRPVAGACGIPAGVDAAAYVKAWNECAPADRGACYEELTGK